MESLLPTSSLPLFLTASLALLLVPGPAVLYIVARGIDQGWRAGLVSVLGIEVANSLHVVAAALGLSTVLMTSALAFDVVKYLGAAYLIYLGIHKLTGRDERQDVSAGAPDSLGRIFRQGVIVNVLNPKVALFFFAFLPQFVDTARGSVIAQILALGLIFVAMATVTDSGYALLSGALGRWLRGNLRFLRFQRLFAGVVYVFLGISAAFTHSSSKT